MKIFHKQTAGGFVNITQFVEVAANMPRIILHYFDFPFWRAEVSRLALHLGKVRQK